MSRVYQALADPTRRRILELLRNRDMSAGEIADHFELAKPTLSKHCAVLKEADLVTTERNGTSIIYSLNVSVLEDSLLSLLSKFQLDPPRRRR